MYITASVINFIDSEITVVYLLILPFERLRLGYFYHKLCNFLLNVEKRSILDIKRESIECQRHSIRFDERKRKNGV